MRAPELSPLEVAAGFVWGFDPDLESLTPDSSCSPRETLDSLVVDALSRSPCVVSFSGGRDSSAVLAVAVEAARRHGLPLPVPVTMRFPAEPSGDEDDWQEAVIAHLGLDEWLRFEIRDELDVVGPYAAPLIRRHGLMCPFNAYFHAPIAERARGGTVLTGVGGDEMFTRSRWRRVNELRSGGTIAGPRDVARLATAYGPRRLRARVVCRGFEPPIWLTADARRRVRRHVRTMSAGAAVDWDKTTVDTWWRSRTRSVGEAGLALVGAAFDTRMIHPLAHPRFLASVAAFGGRLGYASRTQAMEALFDDLLPPAVLSRPTKAYFRRTFWGPDAISFAGGWDGFGIDPGVARVNMLRTLWRRDDPPAGSMLAFQSAWLASQDELSGPKQTAMT